MSEPASVNPAAMAQLAAVPPSWLTQEYFTKALQEYEKDKSLKVRSGL